MRPSLDRTGHSGKAAACPTTAARRTCHDFTWIISGFADNGYLAEVFGETCVDSLTELSDALRAIER